MSNSIAIERLTYDEKQLAAPLVTCAGLWTLLLHDEAAAVCAGCEPDARFVAVLAASCRGSVFSVVDLAITRRGCRAPGRAGGARRPAGWATACADSRAGSCMAGGCTA